MKNIDEIVAADLVELSALSGRFRVFLMKELEYDREEADFVIATDFADPFIAPYIDYEYEGDIVIDGVEYEVYAGVSAFENVGIFLDDDEPSFEFYTLFDKSTLKDDSLDAYRKAKKFYVLQEE